VATIKTPEEAIALANKIAGFAINPEFKSFDVDILMEEKRSNPQNRYYWGVVIEKQYNHFAGDLVSFMGWMFKALRFKLTRDLVHEVNKIIYNSGKSTTKLKMDIFIENFANPIREDMLHHAGIDIPLPEDAGLLESYNEYLSRYGEETTN
jgi:hypothetical protein